MMTEFENVETLFARLDEYIAERKALIESSQYDITQRIDVIKRKIDV